MNFGEILLFFYYFAAAWAAAAVWSAKTRDSGAEDSGFWIALLALILAWHFIKIGGFMIAEKFDVAQTNKILGFSADVFFIVLLFKQRISDAKGNS